MTMTRYILVGLQRSGTSVTHGSLESHPQITAIPQEIRVQPLFSLGPRALTGGDGPYEERRRGHLAIFDGFASTFGNTDGVIGGKIALSSVAETAELVLTLQEFYPGLKIIRVIRRDAVARLASLLRARQSGQWHAFAMDGASTSPQTVLPAKKLVISAAEIESYVEDCELIEALLNTLGDDHHVMTIEYERDVLPGLKPRAMFRFLGVDQGLSEGSSLVKLAADPEDCIQDYQSLREIAAEVRLPDPARVRAILREAQQSRTRSEPVHFLLSRAEFLLEENQPSRVHEDVVMLLSGEQFLRPGVRRHAFDLLERAWLTLRDADLALMTLEMLQPRYGDDAGFAMLQAVTAHHMGEIELARRHLERTLELDPEHERANGLRAALAHRVSREKP